MSLGTRVAERYAKALILEGEEKNLIDTIFEDFNFIKETGDASRDLVLMWRSPVVAPEKKEAIITQLFKGKISDTVLNFLKLLVIKGREEFIREIIARYIELYQEKHGITSVQVTSATDLDDATLTSIAGNLEKGLGKKIDLHHAVDSDLIGGLVIRNKDTQLDLSVKNALNRVKQNLL